jgi:hypothetical protein
MVRPKASEENLEIAAKFVNAITVSEAQCPTRKNIGQINCRGSNSLFAALRQCLPILTRLPKEAALDAVSEIELNKYLARLGYVSYRYRHRIRGTVDKWSKGLQRWRNLRWINTKNLAELEMLHVLIAELVRQFPRVSSLHHGFLVYFLSNKSSSHDDSSMPESDDVHDASPLRFASQFSGESQCPSNSSVTDCWDRGLPMISAAREHRYQVDLVRLCAPRRCFSAGAEGIMLQSRLNRSPYEQYVASFSSYLA